MASDAVQFGFSEPCHLDTMGGIIRSHTLATLSALLMRKIDPMQPQKKFHLVFSFVMGAMMISVMTFVISLVNVGWGPHFLQTWARAFLVAYVVGVPVIFFLAPIARKATGKLLGMPV